MASITIKSNNGKKTIVNNGDYDDLTSEEIVCAVEDLLRENEHLRTLTRCDHLLNEISVSHIKTLETKNAELRSALEYIRNGSAVPKIVAGQALDGKWTGEIKWNELKDK